MVDVYSTEPERQAALTELTALRRELKTETAAGAKAAAKDPRFIAAKERLDKAKSAAGMRTSAEDLAALNRIATSDTATMKKDAQGRMTAAPTKAERAVTKELNAPSKQYFKQVQESYTNPDRPPSWKPRKQITPEEIKTYNESGVDVSKARHDWIWYKADESDPGRWAIGLIGAVQQKPKDIQKATMYDIWYSDSASLAEARKIKNKNNWATSYQDVQLDKLERFLPNITFSEFQEVYYRLTLERDENITVEDILAKYNELYGEG